MTELVSRAQGVRFDELALATRNHGMQLEGMRYDITPIGMHYLLIHFDIPAIDPSTWRLRVTGSVERELELSLDDIRSRPATTIPVTLECAGNGRIGMDPRNVSQPWGLEAIGTASWTGTPLRGILDECRIRDGAVEVVFTGADRGFQDNVEHNYQRSLGIGECGRPEILLAYEMNGVPLPPQHGFPLRLLVPGWYGMTSVKWLRNIEIVDQPFTGIQQAAYRYQQDSDDPGLPVSRIRVRALMVPPGIPDFQSRRRTVEAGTVGIRGRAWCGTAPVAGVEVGVDGVWHDARLGHALAEFAWYRWSYAWDAHPGEYLLSCRATDADGNTQPTAPPWNLLGMGNNLIQEVAVTVR
ncbi:sulfite oxidase [Nocardia sp. GCM10030253]|uniref:sulfite oxidase n=1 Tax=Nocardia sp. GCM10030253 TaxID=3273404 RepID=UPI003645E202